MFLYGVIIIRYTDCSMINDNQIVQSYYEKKMQLLYAKVISHA